MGRLTLVALALLLVPLAFYPHTTGPTEVGVRTVKWAPFGKVGVQPDVYDPGATYFFPAVINDWHTFDTKIQNVEMTFDRNRGDRATRDDLLFKTIDGNDISLDVIVTYRIKKEEAPKIIQQVAANDFELKDKIVRTIARSRPRDIFGELKTEEFYVSDKRDEKAERTRDELNKLFEPYGIVVERVSTKDYRFNPAYQKAIEDKKVADQVAEQNKSATKASQEEYLKRLEDAKGEVAQMVAQSDGRFRQAQIESDAYYEQQQRIAAAIEAEGAAEAKGITEMNKALAGSGGEVMVKLKLAEALEGKRILLLPVSGGGLDVKTTNMNQLLETYGVRKLAEGQ
ncbi:MAG TPA: prohibitin family protein [Candidatus Eisenbacteria bacterium]|nr:prohibitin family protein [Candidatus Eisenbacteria bacterium]